MGKNSHIHLILKTSLLDELKREADEKGISRSELYRQKLRKDIQLTKIEEKLNKIERILEKSLK